MLQNSNSTTETRKPAYSVNEISVMTSLSKSFLRNEIRASKLRAKTFGRRVLVLDADLRLYLESKQDWKPTNSNGENTIEVKG